MADKELFDLEAVYDEQIAPLMTQIIEICKRHETSTLHAQIHVPARRAWR